MATRKQLTDEIYKITREAHYGPADIWTGINSAVTRIAAGIRLPDGRITPPLPDLFSSATVETSTSNPYASLDATYQRNLFLVSDSNKERVPPPRGGDYYSFNTFMRRARYMDLSETGSIYMCCVKGSRLYYQGRPSNSENLLTYFYRKPVDMSADGSTPDGIPEPFQIELLKHFVCKEFFGIHIGDSSNIRESEKGYMKDLALSKFKFHEGKFYDVLLEMVQFIGEEGEPMYFASDFEEEY